MRTPNGNFWSTFTIGYILTNPVYIGNIRWKYRRDSGRKYDPSEVIIANSDHEPIISEELFEKVQQKITERRNKPPRVTTSEYPFTGVLYCPRCGAPMNGNRRIRSKGRISFEYRCSVRTTKTKTACNMPFINELAIEELVLKCVEVFSNTGNYNPPGSDDLPEKTQAKEAIEKEIERIRKRRKKWLREFGDDETTMEDIRELIEEDREREKHLLEELSKFDDTEPEEKLSKEQFLDLSKNFRLIWENADRYERKELIHGLFKKLVIDIDTEKPKIPNKPRPLKLVDYELAFKVT